MQEHCNTLQAENDFKVQCQEELESIIKNSKDQIKQMETEMQVSLTFAKYPFPYLD